ncbi:galactokinase [Corynebacterium bovis]|uniref:galactokinase n=1 Tax=Corynebacterium bovis TaxID=36808 RepID=UPI003CC6FD26
MVMWVTARSRADLAAAAGELFHDSYGAQPAGVWAAPGRVNLIGDHVDYAGGVSVPFALPHCTAAAVARRDDGLLRVVTGRPDGSVSRFSTPLADVGPGRPSSWGGYVAGPVWAAVRDGVVPACPGLDIAVVSDVPVGSGLSSSAAIECSVALAAYWLAAGHRPGPEETARLVEACIRAENEVVGASTGGLDQRSSLYGREGHALAIDFRDDRLDTVPCDVGARGYAFLVADTNAPHALNDGQYASRRGVIDAVTAFAGVPTLRDLGEPEAAAGDGRDMDRAEAVTRAWAAGAEAAELIEGTDAERADTAWLRVRHVLEETDRTLAAAGALADGDLDTFGRLMVASHGSLRDLYAVSTPELDCAQEAAMAAGALGARMTGGGFGGSIIALVRDDAVEQTAEAVAEAARRAGHPEPTFLRVTPSAGADRV